MALVLRIRGSGAGTGLSKAAKAISKGGVVIYPTETSYAIGANACSAEAVLKVRAAKKRPAKKPFSVMVSNLAMAREIAVLGQGEEALVKEFMPGPLTLVAPKRKKLPKELCGKSVAFRVSSNAIARALSRKSGCAVVATSANVSGECPAYSAGKAAKEFGSVADIIIDSGRLPKRKPSTIFDCAKRKVIRRGPVSRARIMEVLKRAQEKK